MKVWSLLLVWFLFTLSPMLMAGGYHRPGPQGEPGPQGDPGIQGPPGFSVIEDRDEAIAAAMIQHHFNPESPKWQASFSVGTFEGTEAYSAAFGKQLCNTCPNTFIHGTTTYVGDETGGSVGVTLSW